MLEMTSSRRVRHVVAYVITLSGVACALGSTFVGTVQRLYVFFVLEVLTQKPVMSCRPSPMPEARIGG
jgi:hypothetical protein